MTMKIMMQGALSILFIFTELHHLTKVYASSTDHSTFYLSQFLHFLLAAYKHKRQKFVQNIVKCRGSALCNLLILKTKSPFFHGLKANHLEIKTIISLLGLTYFSFCFKSEELSQNKNI